MILIAGDSWACGEWNRSIHSEWNTMNIQHGGLSQYLIENDRPALNIGIGGVSNFHTIIWLTNFFKSNLHLVNQISTIIVFQTEWDRDKDYFDVGNDGYTLTKNKWLSQFYYNLSSLSQQLDIPIWIVGGCSDAIWLDRFSEEYPGVQVVCQSFTNLLLNDNHRTDTPVHSILTDKNNDLISAIKKQSDSADLSELIADMDRGAARLNTWKSNREWFWPDGRHANRIGHKKLFDFLSDEYNL
jgi:hypothetical protein